MRVMLRSGVCLSYNVVGPMIQIVRVKVAVESSI